MSMFYKNMSKNKIASLLKKQILWLTKIFLEIRLTEISKQFVFFSILSM